MALDDIVLVDKNSANKSYALFGIPSGERVNRKDFTNSTAEEPLTFAIAHQVTGKTVKVDRHMCRHDQVILLDDGVTPAMSSVWICFAIDRRISDAADAWNQTCLLTSYLTEANVGNLVLGKL
jgi:hypothetical protein